MTSNKTIIGIIGTGQFGKVLKRLITEHAPQYDLLTFDNTPDSDQIGNLEDLTECDVVIPAVPISVFESVIKQIASHLKRDALVIDVCSVKQHPVRMMLEHLPATTSIIASHPMFGPQSLRHTDWQLSGLPLVIWPVRGDDTIFSALKQKLLDLGLKVIQMNPDDHDWLMADSQFLSLLMGSLLVNKMHIESTPIDTPAFSKLLEAANITKDDYNILLDAYQYNPACRETLQRLKDALAQIEQDMVQGDK